MQYCKYSGIECSIRMCENVNNCGVAKELDRIKSQQETKSDTSNRLEKIAHLGLVLSEDILSTDGDGLSANRNKTPADSSYSCSNINRCANSSDKCSSLEYRNSCPVKSDFDWKGF